MTSGCLHWRISVASCRLLLTALLWLSVATSGVAAEADSNPLQPVDTSSPRSTFLAFRENTEAAYRRWRLREGRMATEVEVRRAFRTLDLSRIGEALLEEIGIGDALYLYDTMNRIDLPPARANTRCRNGQGAESCALDHTRNGDHDRQGRGRRTRGRVPLHGGQPRQGPTVLRTGAGPAAEARRG